MYRSTFALAAFAGLTATAAFGATPQYERWEEMDYGRFLTASWDNTKGENTLKGKGCTTNKGIAIQLGDKAGGMLFDTDLCRMSAGWVNGYITYKGVIFDGAHGPNPSPAKGANLYFQTDPSPTWSKGGSFADPRKVPTGPGAAKVPFGPLPKDWAKYKGLYLNGDQVVLNYTVGDAELLESPALEKIDGVPVLTRTFNVVKAGGGTGLILGEWRDAKIEEKDGAIVVTSKEGTNVVLRLVGAPEGAKAAIDGERVVLNFAAFAAGQNFKVAYASNSGDAGGAAYEAANKVVDFSKFAKEERPVNHSSLGAVLRALDARKKELTKKKKSDKEPEPADKAEQLAKLEAATADAFVAASLAGPVAPAKVGKVLAALNAVTPAGDLKALTHGGPRRWKEDVKTVLNPGNTAKPEDAYVVDTVEVPFDNPYKSWMRVGAFDFFKDGRIAVSTWSGDVWVVSGVKAEGGGEVKWQRVATGLFQALGLKIVDDKIYVHGREGLTRLSDLNGDGEMDFYENFNNDIQTSPGFHEFAFDLQTDSKGNFYFGKGGPVNPGGQGFQALSDHAGTILKVSADGQKMDIVATGVRAPNGISVGPGDVITTGDNEGTWVPKCYVHIVKPNDFITVASLAHKATPPTDYGRHICFMPKDVDNSGGGQAWVPGNDWGVPAGTLLHLSYGTCSLYGVMHEDVNGVEQGGVYKFPVKFDSGTMRARFSPVDHQLWISGLRGWQTSAARDAMLQRVRYTGQKVYFPAALKVQPNGVELSFTNPIDAKSAADKENYSVKQWNYKWTGNYGSDNYKPSDGTKGEDVVEVKNVRVSEDRKKVFLEIDGLQPVMQMEIKYDLKGENGATIPGRILNTINVVPGGKTAAQ